MKLKVLHDGEWREYPAKVYTDTGWTDFTLQNPTGLQRIWQQASQPPAGTTYAWAGVEGNSVSIKYVDGVEVARNLADNPIGASSAGWRNNNTAIWGIEKTAITDHPLGIETGFRSYAVDASRAQGAVVSMYDFGGSRLSETVPLLGHGVWVYPTVDSTVRGYVVPNIPVPANKWSWVAYAMPDRNRGALWVHPVNPDDVATAEAIVTGALLIAADTEAEALAQVAEYFDGDSPDDRTNDLWINASGTPHHWVKGDGWQEV